jgi:hypothetical protein
MSDRNTPTEPEETPEALVVAPAADEYGDGDNGGHLKTGPVKLTQFDPRATEVEEAEV